jgi:hypothetical protein
LTFPSFSEEARPMAELRMGMIFDHFDIIKELHEQLLFCETGHEYLVSHILKHIEYIDDHVDSILVKYMMCHSREENSKMLSYFENDYIHTIGSVMKYINGNSSTTQIMYL